MMNSEYVKQANKAFRQGSYEEAMRFYQKAALLIGKSFFEVNISLCKKRLDFPVNLVESKQSEVGKITSRPSVQSPKVALTTAKEKEIKAVVAGNGSKLLPKIEVFGRGVNYPDLRVASILDEFSHLNFAQECTLIPLGLKTWKEQMQAEKPALLLVESAWFGNQGEWQYKITYSTPRPENPLFELLAYCEQVGIPTVFWNKEDPSNYDQFIDAAARFEHIFTTDVNCIPKYEQDAPNSIVSVLPFAAQPAIQNPVGQHLYEKLGDICFAGAWYPRHPERHEDAKILLDASKDYRLDIYDRYLNHPQSEKYRFPDDFQPYIRGSLKFDEMVYAYRQYPVFLNVNSVKNSPTMFSRRVLELLACGTAVVSGYADGLDSLLGEGTIPQARTTSEAKNVIDRFLGDDTARQKAVLSAQRKIFGEHTYQHRIKSITKSVGVDLPEEKDFVSVITATIRKDFVDNFLENFQRQSHPDKELIVVVNRERDLTKKYLVERCTALGVSDVRVIQVPEKTTLGACLNVGVDKARGNIFAKMDDDDYYSEHYLTDSVQALHYSGADCVGKKTYYTYSEGHDQLFLRTAGCQHRYTDFVIGTTLVAWKRIFPTVTFGNTRVGEDSIFLRNLKLHGMKLYSHSQYNYSKYYARSLDHHTWKITADKYLKGANEVADGFDPAVFSC